MQIIIPMAGIGKRFLEAGYKDPKPLIDVDGDPIIKHVLDMFPNEKNVTFICNDKHLKETEMRKILNKFSPNCKIFEVPVSTKKGPVDVVSSIFDHINDNEEVIVSYCDYGSKWNYELFLKNTRELDSDGAIICYRNFHPHMLGSDHYAYVKSEGNIALEVSEKKPFKEDKMADFASNGAYYFKSGKILKKYFSLLLQSGQTIKNEYYVSMVYNFLIKDGLKVSIFEIEKMLQWGTPYDLEVYKSWLKYFKNKRNQNINIIQKDTTLILPMAGKGSRFSDLGYQTPKPLLNIDGEPMIVQAVKCLPECEENTFICLEEHDKQYNLNKVLQSFFKNSTVKTISNVTEGQACTVQIGIEASNIDIEKPILVSASDNGVVYDIQKYISLIKDDSIDVIVWTFRNNPTSKNNPNMYSWLEVDENNKIKKVHCKKFIFDDPLRSHAIIGTMFFRKAKYFIEGFLNNKKENIRTNGEFYVDDVINANIKMGLSVFAYEVENYICWGTPDDYKTYNYWKEYFDK